jgi:hypothetical protein
MRRLQQLFVAAAVATTLPVATDAQTPAAGDHDDQLVVTGCVTRSTDVRGVGPQSIFLWSRGDVYLASPDVRFRPSEAARPVGTAGVFIPIVYWIDDEDDFAKHVGNRVEIVGEIDDEIEKGELEFEHEGDVTEIEFAVNGREANAKIPTAWLGPQTQGRDVDLDVRVRTVDVEKVTVLGSCTAR